LGFPTVAWFFKASAGCPIFSALDARAVDDQKRFADDDGALLPMTART
jgi:hypothetical protein